MSKKTFEVEVTRTDTYKIEIDTDVINDEWMQDYRKAFYPVDTHSEVAEDIANKIMRHGSNYGFLEGFGYLHKLRRNGTEIVDHKTGYKPVTMEEKHPGITVHIIREDEQYDFNTTEVKEVA